MTKVAVMSDDDLMSFAERVIQKYKSYEQEYEGYMKKTDFIKTLGISKKFFEDNIEHREEFKKHKYRFSKEDGSHIFIKVDEGHKAVDLIMEKYYKESN